MMYCIRLSGVTVQHCQTLSCMPSNLVSPHTNFTAGTDEEGVPSESYLQEVREQMEKRREELEGNQRERVARSVPDNSDGE